MTTKQLLFKILSKATFASVMLFSASEIFAQVKIGTAPTTIDPNNNLEVQGSTSGRKLTVHKTTGKLTYADATQGNGKVLTSDANGVASWQDIPETGLVVLRAYNPNTLQPTGLYFTPSVPRISGTATDYNGTTGTYTVPTSGFYDYNISCSVTGPAGDIFTTAVTPLDIEDGSIRGMGISTNYRSLSGAKWYDAGQTITFFFGRGGGLVFNTDWKIARIGIVIVRY